MPEEEKDERDQAAFEDPDRDRAQAGQQSVLAADVPEQGGGGSEDRDCQ